ncbi:Gfo/Idh/MocA family protein [Desulfatirhabdium butyrativorans]|uniref:Gfo/Idh/MocA family protein n=1 Tax=Desulfatirhabdium butyrativorans TaxID=340467 RepID=UPI000400E915|nr:Gfo/Idh/MocA family oxidoreductase [Desulfatirhabdium butyrativorans]
MKQIRVGVVGVGYLGAYHAEKYAQMPGVELVGVADIDAARAAEIAGKCHTASCADHRDLIGKVDAVSIAVSTSQHYAVARDFLENGVDVLIEKPMTTSLEEADALIALAQKNGLILQVGHLERFNPTVVALQDIVTRPLFIESHRLSIFKPRCTDVSVILDLMIHDIDLILSFVRSSIREIRASGVAVISEHVDIANARLEFASGCVANVTASRISTKNERKLRIFQQDAYVSVDFANRNILCIRKNGGQPDSLIPGADIQSIRFDAADALNDELIAFVEAVRSRNAPPVTGEMGRDALKAALDILETIQAFNRRHAEVLLA